MGTMSKLGLHILGGYRGELGRPRVIKLVDVSLEYKREVRADVGPDCLIIIRWTLPESAQRLDDPVRRAREWYVTHRDTMLAMAHGDPNVVFETAYNEIPNELAAPFAVFLVEVLRLMHGDNLRGAAGNWSVGTPEPEMFDTVYLPVLEALGPGDLLALHEYFADGADLANVWHIGRWRLNARLANIPKVITETGRDVFTENGRTFGYPGWHADPHCTPNVYLAELRGLNSLLASQPSVVGAVVFTAGQIISEKWQDYEVNSIADIIVAEQGELLVAPAPVLRHPLPGARISQRFGENRAYYARYGSPGGHNGIDLAVPAGTDVRDWHAKTVVAANSGPAVIVDDPEGYGLYVYIWGNDGYDTLYAHLAHAFVPADKRVEAGQPIGWMGYTGNCAPTGIYGTHLHFGVRPRPYRLDNGTRGYVDPIPLIS